LVGLLAVDDDDADVELLLIFFVDSRLLDTFEEEFMAAMLLNGSVDVVDVERGEESRLEISTIFSFEIGGRVGESPNDLLSSFDLLLSFDFFRG